jgi:hypothetical protein
MERHLLQEKIIDGLRDLPDDKVFTVLDFIGYLKFLVNRQISDTSESSKKEWEEATESLLSLSGMFSSGTGDMAGHHDDYLYGSKTNEL